MKVINEIARSIYIYIYTYIYIYIYIYTYYTHTRVDYALYRMICDSGCSQGKDRTVF